MRKTHIAKLLALVLAAATAISCDPTLPDLQPFAKATEEMSGAIARGYQETQSQYLEALQGIKGDDEDVTFPKVGDVDCNKTANQFVAVCVSQRNETCDKAENTRSKSCLKWESAVAKYYSKAVKETLNGMMDYSNSLAAIAESGNKGKESVEAVANSLTGLISAATPLISPLAALNLGANPVFNGVIEAAKAINGYVAKVRARKKLQEAVNDSAEAVAKLEIVLNHTLSKLQRINKSAATKLASDFLTLNQPLVDYYESKLKMMDSLYQVIPLIDRYFQSPGSSDAAEANRMAIYKQIADKDSSLPACTTATSCPAHDVRVEKLRVKRKEAQDQLKSLRDEIDLTKGQYGAYEKRYKEIVDRGERNGRLLDVAGEAVTAWAKGHKDLQSVLNRSSRRATFIALVNLGKELVAIYEDTNKKEGA